MDNYSARDVLPPEVVDLIDQALGDLGLHAGTRFTCPICDPPSFGQRLVRWFNRHFGRG